MRTESGRGGRQYLKSPAGGIGNSSCGDQKCCDRPPAEGTNRISPLPSAMKYQLPNESTPEPRRANGSSGPFFDLRKMNRRSSSSSVPESLFQRTLDVVDGSGCGPSQ